MLPIAPSHVLTRVLACGLILSTAWLAACGTGQTHPPPASEEATASGGTTSRNATTAGSNVAHGTSGAVSPHSNGLPSSDEFITPPVDSRTGEGPNTDEACRLSIMGDPGFNPGANFAQWIEQRGPVVDRYVAGIDLQSFTLADLQTYDVVLLDRLAPDAELGITPSEFAGWVGSGGRVIALSGYGDYPEVVQVQNAVLAPLGLGFVSETPVWGPVTQFSQHPINGGLQSLTFVGGREVIHEPADDVIMTLGDAADPVGVVAVRGSGRLFLFGDEWVTFDSEWVAMPEIEQFWVNIFDWLGGCKLLPPSIAR